MNPLPLAPINYVDQWSPDFCETSEHVFSIDHLARSDSSVERWLELELILNLDDALLIQWEFEFVYNGWQSDF